MGNSPVDVNTGSARFLQFNRLAGGQFLQNHYMFRLTIAQKGMFYKTILNCIESGEGAVAPNIRPEWKLCRRYYFREGFAVRVYSHLLFAGVRRIENKKTMVD